MRTEDNNFPPSNINLNKVNPSLLLWYQWERFLVLTGSVCLVAEPSVAEPSLQTSVIAPYRSDQDAK